MDNNQVKSTTDYSKFKFITNNRKTFRAHVEALKKSFEETGNLTEVQPILVNEKMEIIDGQHRFTAAQETGSPVFYMQRTGLTVHDARAMNILHRNWTARDYAQSYADDGNINYIDFLELMETYELPLTITMIFSLGVNSRGQSKKFREGDLVIESKHDAMARLDKFTEVRTLLPIVGNDLAFAQAFLKALGMPGFDYKRLLNKCRLNGNIMRKYGSTEDYGRALEELYNYGYQDANRMRLY